MVHAIAMLLLSLLLLPKEHESKSLSLAQHASSYLELVTGAHNPVHCSRTCLKTDEASLHTHTQHQGVSATTTWAQG
jgi:hypothetical protein